jgi:hypothetical protein
MKKFSSILILLTILIFCNSCAEQVDLEFPENMTEYGFFSGLWHGFIAPFSLIGMFFGLDVVVFAIKNTGFFLCARISTWVWRLGHIGFQG